MTDGFQRLDRRDDNPHDPPGGDGHGGGSPGSLPGETRAVLNRRSIYTVGLALVFAMLVSSVLPGPLVAAGFSEICFFAAMGIGIVAAFRQEPIAGAPVFTGWDRAAVMLLASQISGLFIDHDAVVQYLEQVQQTGGL